MANAQPEQDLLNELFNKCELINEWTVHTYKCRHTPYMDFEATVTLNDSTFYLKCEAKVASKLTASGAIDIRYGDRHNVNHKVFGEIIKGRNSADCINHSYEKCYGLIIPRRDFDFFKNKYCTMLDDWLTFGSAFDSKYVIVFDERQGNLDVYLWSDVWLQSNYVVVRY